MINYVKFCYLQLKKTVEEKDAKIKLLENKVRQMENKWPLTHELWLNLSGDLQPLIAYIHKYEYASWQSVLCCKMLLYQTKPLHMEGKVLQHSASPDQALAHGVKIVKFCC